MQALNELSEVIEGILGNRRGRKGRAGGSKTAQFALEGELRPGKESEYSVAGQDLMVDAGTWIFGELEYGKPVTVRGVYSANGLHYAKKVIVKNS